MAQIRSCSKSVLLGISRLFAVGVSVLASTIVARPVAAEQSQSSLSIVGVNNQGYIASLDQHGASDGSVSTATAMQSFTGKDGNGATQTMVFNGTTITQSSFGRLHSYAAGAVQNAYYNASNPAFADQNGSIINTSGSPSTLTSLGFASFTDTLQYGGTLQSGYKARYLFHVEGTNSGTGALADLAVNVDNNPGDSFFAGATGFYSAIWATSDYDVNGITPQKIRVQFSDQVVFDLFNLTDGQNYSGTSDFSSTATLIGIELVDANGVAVPTDTWSVASESGTTYTQVTPEPACLLLVLLGGSLRMARRHGSATTPG